MKKLGVSIRLLMILLGLVFLQSCSKSLSLSPASPYTPTTSANLLSAFATIGSNPYFIDPAGIQYCKGHLWVTNQSCTLQEWTTIGTAPITTISGCSADVTFTNLGGDCLDPISGNVYLADEQGGQIEVFDPTGNYLTVFGNTQMGVTNGSYFSIAWTSGVAVNSAGTTVYALGQATNTVYVYSIGGTASNPTYTYQFSFGNTGSGPATLNLPGISFNLISNLTVDSGGNVWVGDTDNHRLAEYSGTGGYLNSFKVSGLDVNFSPVDVLIDAAGNVYGVDYNAGVVVKFNPSGKVMGQFGQGILNGPNGIATDGSGNFFVTNSNPQQIVAFH